MKKRKLQREKGEKITKAKSLGRRVGITAQGRAGVGVYCSRNEGRQAVLVLLCARAVLRSSVHLNSSSPHSTPVR